MIKIEYEQYKLKNGIEVLLIPSSTTYSVTIKSFINSGSALESKSEQGISHFIEHICSSTTEKWPTKENLSEIIELNGGNANAWTSKENISYYINVPYNKIEFGIEYISQILFYPKFTKNSIEKEKTIILDELSKNLNDVGYRNNVYATSAITINGSGYVHEIIGSKDSIKSFDIRLLTNKIKELHDPSKIQLLIVGNFIVNDTKRLIEDYFEKQRSKYQPTPFPKESIKSSYINSKADKQSRLISNIITFNTLSDIEMTTRQDLLFDIIVKLISGTSTSRLYKRLREQESLLYHITCGGLTYKPFGLVAIQYESIPQQFEKTFKIVIEELNKLAINGVTQKELDHISEYTTNRNLVYYDNIHSYSKLISSTLLNNKEFYSLEKINKTIKEFTTEEISQTIKQYLKIEDLNSIAYGNISSGTTEMMQKVISNAK